MEVPSCFIYKDGHASTLKLTVMRAFNIEADAFIPDRIDIRWVLKPTTV